MGTSWGATVRLSVLWLAGVGVLMSACAAFKYTPTIEAFLTTPSGEPGWVCTFYNSDGNGVPISGAVKEYVLRDTRIRLNDFLPEGLGETWMLKLHG